MTRSGTRVIRPARITGPFDLLDLKQKNETGKDRPVARKYHTCYNKQDTQQMYSFMNKTYVS